MFRIEPGFQPTNFFFKVLRRELIKEDRSCENELVTSVSKSHEDGPPDNRRNLEYYVSYRSVIVLVVVNHCQPLIDRRGRTIELNIISPTTISF